MKELPKTLAWLAVALVVAVVAWATGPRAMVDPTRAMLNQPLFPEFTDPLAATDLEIVEYDEDTATIRPFRVAQQVIKGRTLWSIPSHDNYPADAKDQLAEAAAGLVGVEVLGVQSDQPGDHELYGVIDPGDKDLKPGQRGVGTRVTMKDASGKTLLALVIGKKAAEEGDLYYVRRVGEPGVYVAKVKTDKLSTKFSDWIEKDLLKLNPWDIKRLWIRDHSVDELQGAVIQRGEMVLEYNDTGDPRWKLVEDEVFENNRWVPRTLADNEELDNAKLDDLKYALDDLKIVDVRPKPPGLSADLKATGDFQTNREAVESLADRGFYVARLGDQIELFSNEGEIRVLMKDGVEYTLRFGEVAAGADLSKAEKKTAKEEGKSAGMNRYLFVTAAFNPEAIEKPQFEPLPADPAQPADSAAPAPTAPGAPVEATPPQGSPAMPGGEQPARSGDSATSAAPGASGEAGQAGQAGQTGEPAEQPAATGPTAPAGEAAAPGAANEQPASGTAPGAEPKPAATDAQKERERIEKENKRKQEEYDEKLKKGRERVDELNRRFGDWYYIISDEIYQKIHLSRDQIVKKKEKKEGEGGEHGEGDHDHAAPGDASKPADNPIGEFDRMKEAGPGTGG